LLSFGSDTFVFQFAIKKKIKIYRAIILSVVVYGYERQSLTLRKKHRLRVLSVEGAEEDIQT
jgi:hypothetical protein